MIPAAKRRAPDHQRPIELVDLVLAERPGELRGGCGGLGDDQKAARVAIEPMHEAGPLTIARQRREHAVDVAPRPRAALDREAFRLVQDDQALVLDQNQAAQKGGIVAIDRRLRPGGCERGGERRHADGLAGRKARVGLGSPAVDPHLAGAQQLLQPAVVQGREVTAKPAIKPKLGLARRHGPELDLAHDPAPRVARSFAQASSRRLILASSPSPVG